MKTPPTKKSLRTRILVLSTILALGPMSVLIWRIVASSSNVKADIVQSFESYAVESLDTIERNLFERYGDVQAFSANEVVLDRTQWGKSDEESNGIVRAMNKYMDLYDIYSLMIAVDLEGKPIAVNSRDAEGNPIDNSWVFEMNFKEAPWFKDTIAGRFLEGDGTSGTVVEDVQVDSLVKRVSGGEGYAFSYSAPFHDSNGKTIGVWTNRVSLDLINSILEDSYSNLRDIGYQTAELTLLNRHGKVISELDPSQNKGVNQVIMDPQVVLNLNLAQAGVEVAKQAVNGESGATFSFHTRKEIEQVAGFAHSKGALGYAGLGWNMLVRIDKAEVMGAFDRLNLEILAIFLLAAVVAPFFAWRLSGKISQPLQALSHELTKTADATRNASGIVNQNAKDLAHGATEQAANVEETSASAEELSSMTAQNSENVSKALSKASEASVIVDSSNQQLKALSNAMSEISKASDDTKNIIKTIDEIAFQTNILALNAAVEAARAGEAGAGFAIVADEVRNLAQRAAQAAQNTSTLIDQNIDKIKQGSHSLEQTNTGFARLVVATNEISQIMADIDEASRQQSQGLSQINTAVSQISTVTQQNASSSEETASAASELDSQAEALGRVANQLKVIIEGGIEASYPNRRYNELSQPYSIAHESPFDTNFSRSSDSQALFN